MFQHIFFSKSATRAKKIQNILEAYFKIPAKYLMIKVDYSKTRDEPRVYTIRWDREQQIEDARESKYGSYLELHPPSLGDVDYFVAGATLAM